MSELTAYVNDVFGSAGLPDVPEHEVIFVAPLGAAIPEDGVFNYTTVNNLSDIGAVPARSVILFGEDQNEALAVLAKHCDLFHRSVQMLFGVPGSDYGPWFDDATFSLERIAYGAFVAELRAASEIAKQTRADERSGTKVESDRYTRANGDVRYSASITAGDDSDVDE